MHGCPCMVMPWDEFEIAAGAPGAPRREILPRTKATACTFNGEVTGRFLSLKTRPAICGYCRSSCRGVAGNSSMKGMPSGNFWLWASCFKRA